MKIITLADSAGFCFGVKRAVDTALNMKHKYNKEIYTLGPLIHNNDVVKFLKDNSIYPIEFDEIDKLEDNDTLIIRSHGISEETLDKLNKTNLNIIDATCPPCRKYTQKSKKIL